MPQDNVTYVVEITIMVTPVGLLLAVFLLAAKMCDDIGADSDSSGDGSDSADVVGPCVHCQAVTSFPEVSFSELMLNALSANSSDAVTEQLRLSRWGTHSTVAVSSVCGFFNLSSESDSDFLTSDSLPSTSSSSAQLPDREVGMVLLDAKIFPGRSDMATDVLFKIYSRRPCRMFIAIGRVVSCAAPPPQPESHIHAY